ncbi:MAG: hypothetical protein PHP95_09415 [Desulfuromonadaceae bacterium]|nr:hypothetical protein [Desulfuromonadaceae bacterium]MDD2848662.1 hypothetical protein [Desulfuromonadaceae bacterium]MDD4130835.1 hypothetical protein [Desulfuromonadaceae bacterium]
MTNNTEKIFGRLNVDHPLVDELASGKHVWWNRLVGLSHSDPDINIQVRGSYLNVYCKMGNLLKIYMQGKKVACKVHYKYLVGARTPEYIETYPSGDDIGIKEKPCDFVNSILDEKFFKAVKQNIGTYAGEEKRIQSRLVEKNKGTILDVEVAFSDTEVLADSDDGNTRIDFANYDKNMKCLVFIELKQIFDSRLYTKEMNEQIQKYSTFAKKHEQPLIAAYNDVIQVKKKLGIIDQQSPLWNVVITRVEHKPILAVAGYNQTIIDAMKPKIRGINNDKLDTSKLAALCFFGTDSDLNLKKGKNKEVYI